MERREATRHADEAFQIHKSPPEGRACSASGRIRTSDFRFRRPTLYPAELRMHGRRKVAA